MDIETWLDDLIAPETRAAAAKRAGYSQSTISRQLDRGHLRPEMVISLCRAYGRSPVDGLVETGYLYPHEIEGVGVSQALDMATNRQVLALIERRITARDDRDFRGAGDDNVIGLHRHSDFDPLLDVATDDDQDAMRHPGHDDHP